MDANALYNKLLDEIHLDQVALDEKKELARLLKKRLGSIEPAALATASVAKSFVLPLRDAPTSEPRTLVQMVEVALPDLDEQDDFAVGNVAEAIKGRGFNLPDKPNPRITTVLARLQSLGVIERTFTGGGNVPNRFRRVRS